MAGFGWHPASGPSLQNTSQYQAYDGDEMRGSGMGAYEPLDCRVIVSVAIRNVSESYSARSLKLTVTVLNRTGCMIAVPT